MPLNFLEQANRSCNGMELLHLMESSNYLGKFEKSLVGRSAGRQSPGCLQHCALRFGGNLFGATINRFLWSRLLIGGTNVFKVEASFEACDDDVSEVKLHQQQKGL